MATLKIILLAILAAVVLGCVGGVLVGKYLVKRSKSERKPVLSKKERIICIALIAVGTASILFGVFFKFPKPADTMNMEGPGMVQNGEGEATTPSARAEGG